MTNPLMPGLAKELVKYWLEQNTEELTDGFRELPEDHDELTKFVQDRDQVFTEWVLGMIEDGDLVVELDLDQDNIAHQEQQIIDRANGMAELRRQV